MKNYIFILILISMNSWSKDLIVPENIVDSWGFKTIEVTEYGQMIWSNSSFQVGGQTYYPRYYLRKECYETETRAKEVYLLKSSTKSNGKDEYRGNFFLGLNCVYQIDPNADIFKYHDESGVVELYGKYVQSGT